MSHLVVVELFIAVLKNPLSFGSINLDPIRFPHPLSQVSFLSPLFQPLPSHKSPPYFSPPPL
jgi:hypothetical protein